MKFTSKTFVLGAFFSGVMPVVVNESYKVIYDRISRKN